MARNQDDSERNLVTLQMMDSPFWQQLWIAISLVLVIEGILPFLYPERWRQLVAQIALIDNKTMRIVGLVSMLSGIGLLLVVT
jgi:uncharacterized protein YjeT (DUF2065 family)